jgi:hypothetical protein
MALDLRKLLSWPIAAAVLFLLIPPALFYLYPTSFWVNTDYQPHGLADALNLAYRIADLQLYPARGMADHPGVPFYFMSWLALALAGYPIAFKSPGFYTAVLEHVDAFFQITIWLAALTGAAGVYVFARRAQKLAPAGIVALGLVAWLVSTPGTLLMFMSLSIDSFAILINGLFFLALVRLAYDRNVVPGVAVLTAVVAAFAYLNKLPYIYVALALAATGLMNLAFRRPGWIRSGWLCVLFVAVFFAIVMTVGFGIIGRQGFHDLIEFHKHIFRGSGMYGTGDEVVVSGEAVRRAFAAIPVDKTYAVIVALLGGASLIAGGFVTALRRPQHFPTAIIAVGAGLASALSAIIVLKHYDLHYTAGVSATLPACLVGGYLLMKDWGLRPRLAATLLAAVAIVAMATQTIPSLVSTLASRARTSVLARRIWKISVRTLRETSVSWSTSTGLRSQSMVKVSW